ncbi:(2Fe-2S)-binding protein [Thioalkalivibrio sp.]|uniref:(2Fe-2S)-binding protein n=1 Tax=Thioalkalivibrio sp. TaxID=2093813 RepID=UPI00397718FD
MYVCVCKGVREGDIRSLARTETGLRMRDLRERLGVCSECGKCGRRALGMLREGEGGVTDLMDRDLQTC